MSAGWRKLGLIFRPDPGRSWMRSHAALPVAVPLEDGSHRVYYAGRDDRNRSHVGYFDIDLDDPPRVLRVAAEPVLAPGPLGHFDDHGVYAASAVRHESRIYLYTIGWNPGPVAPLFYSSIGLAVSDDGGRSFRKHGTSPIMGRSDYDPCLVTSPMVLKEGARWRMWYVSGYAWEASSEGPRSRYHIKYAESADGIQWQRGGLVCIDRDPPKETNIARCCIVRADGGYEAWFSSDRGQGYRIGHARSRDGLTWERLADPPGLEPSSSGWDSQAMAYPYVVRHRDGWYMFYNGNQFGKDGIGLAVLEP